MSPQSQTLAEQAPSAELVALGNLILGVINEMPNATSSEIDEEFRTRYEHLASDQWNKRIDEETLWLEAQIKRAQAKPAAATPAPAKSKTLLDWALEALERGEWVLPCVPRGKEPATARGVLDASNDPSVIKAWWAKNPEYNPAIALGPSNLVVNDYDLIAPPEPSVTRRVKSGRIQEDGADGGYHDFFIGSTNTHSIFAPPLEPVIEREEVIEKGSKKGEKVIVRYDARGRKVHKKGVAVGEVRSRGAYVMAPGAIHPSGRMYTIVCDLPLVPYPEQNAEKVYDMPTIGSEALAKISEHVESAFVAAEHNYKLPEGYEGGLKWLVDCPQEHEHSGGKDLAGGGSSSAVILKPSGALIYTCRHASCEEYRWKEFRQHLEDSAGKKLQFGDLAAPTVFIAGVPPAKVNPLVAPAIDQTVAPLSPAPKVTVKEDTNTGSQVAEKAEAASAVVVANLVAADNWSGKIEEIIPAFDPTVITGIYKDIVELATKGTTLVPQFIYEYAKTLIGAKMAGKVKLNSLTAEPRRYTAAIGETGAGKGAAWDRLAPIFFPSSRNTEVDEEADSMSLFSRPSDGNGLSVIHSFDSFAGLKDAFFGLPENTVIVCLIEEIRDFGNKGKDSKNPDVIDALTQMADSMNISRVTSKKQGGAGGTKTKADARLVVIACGQDGETYMHALSGQTKVGLPDRLVPEFSVAVEGGDLYEINKDEAAEMYSRIALLDYSGTMTMSDDASEMIRIFWKGLLPEVRKKVRWLKGLKLDAQLIAFGRGSKVVELEDAENAIKIFSRQVIIRKVCFKNDAGDRMGFYSARCKEITARIGRQLSEGIPVESAAKSEGDYERITNARRNHEEHIFVRVFKIHKSNWLKPVSIQYPDGRKFTKYIPADEAPDSETD